MGERRGAYRALVGKPEGRRPLGRPRRRWEDNIKMDLRELGWAGMDWINLAEDRGRWWALANAVMNLWVPLNAGNFLSSLGCLASQEGLCSMEYVSPQKAATCPYPELDETSPCPPILHSL
jgi:hypothetical protein